MLEPFCFWLDNYYFLFIFLNFNSVYLRKCKWKICIANLKKKKKHLTKNRPIWADSGTVLAFFLFVLGCNSLTVRVSNIVLAPFCGSRWILLYYFAFCYIIFCTWKDLMPFYIFIHFRGKKNNSYGFWVICTNDNCCTVDCWNFETKSNKLMIWIMN